MQASYTTPWLQDSAGHPPWGSPCCQLDLVFWAAAPSSTSLCRQAWGSPVCTLMRQPDSPICPVLAQQVAAAVLQQWGPSGGEERVVSHSLGALRALTNNPVAARAVVMSAAWEQLAAAVLAMVRGDAGSALAQVPPKIQGMLVALMLAPTRCIGAETAAYEEAETLSGPEVLETLQVRRCGSSGGSQRYPPTAPFAGGSRCGSLWAPVADVVASCVALANVLFHIRDCRCCHLVSPSARHAEPPHDLYHYEGGEKGIG